MTLYSDPRLLSLGVVHGTADRTAGNMRDSKNVCALLDTLNIPPQRMLRLHQTHSDTILNVLSAEEALNFRQTVLPEADGWVLKGSGFGAAILTADCVPLILWDAKAQVVGLAHCGWRGVAAGLPEKTAQRMKECGAQGPLSAWAGPHIQSCCFEVQQDVADQFPHAVLHKNGKLFVDLNQEIKRQLCNCGLEEKNIKTPYYCTCGDKARFFSFRRDHTKDSLLTFVYRP